MSDATIAIPEYDERLRALVANQEALWQQVKGLSAIIAFQAGRLDTLDDWASQGPVTGAEEAEHERIHRDDEDRTYHRERTRDATGDPDLGPGASAAAAAIVREHLAQRAKYDTPHDRRHDDLEWHALFGDYAGRFGRAALDDSDADGRRLATILGALALSYLESRQ